MEKETERDVEGEGWRERDGEGWREGWRWRGMERERERDGEEEGWRGRGGEGAAGVGQTGPVRADSDAASRHVPATPLCRGLGTGREPARACRAGPPQDRAGRVRVIGRPRGAALRAVRGRHRTVTYHVRPAG